MVSGNSACTMLGGKSESEGRCGRKLLFGVLGVLGEWWVVCCKL